MDVRNLVVERNSEEEFCAAFDRLVSAGISVLQVRTAEIVRTANILRAFVLGNEEIYYEWDIINGMRNINMQNRTNPAEAPPVSQYGTLGEILERIWTHFCEIGNGSDEPGAESRTIYYVLINPQFYMENNPVALQRIIYFATHLANSDIRVVLLTGNNPLPPQYTDYAVTLDFTRPGYDELDTRADLIFDDVGESYSDMREDEDFRMSLAVAGAGMTQQEFDTALARAVVMIDRSDGLTPEEEREVFISSVGKQKVEIVKKNDLLEVIASESMDHVGGMEKLKEWVGARASCYSKEAAAFGIEAPKGMVLVGVPGTGKSLAAKAVSSEFGIPLIRLDFSKVFNSLVGSSEQRMRMALQMIEAMAPCVCFADEIDKGLGGIMNGGGDAGTSMRVLGVFLTWLQENKLPVFTIVTANNVNGLPPELLRRGRFDAIFSTTLPTPTERREVLAIHLERRGHAIDEFSLAEINEFITLTEGYVPAEIEACVKDGLVAAFNESDRTLRIGHLMGAANAMVPLSRSHADAIAAMVRWSANNAIPASFTDVERGQKGRVPTNRARLIKTTRTRGTPNNVQRLDTTRKRPSKDKE